MSRVNVCMATYNGEKYIRRQLMSILAQLNVDDGIIVSDDSSTDNTMQIIADINDERIYAELNPGRPGPIGNFEQALKRANSPLILLADQDDVWLPNKVSLMRTLLQSYDLVLSDCQGVDGNGLVLYNSFFNLRGSKVGFWRNLYKNSYVGCCMAFRSEVLIYALPFPSSVHMHDWWIGLLVELKGKVFFYPQPLIQYVRHGSNASPTGEKGYNFSKRLYNRLLMLFYLAKRMLV